MVYAQPSQFLMKLDILVHLNPAALILKFWINRTRGSGITSPQFFPYCVKRGMVA